MLRQSQVNTLLMLRKNEKSSLSKFPEELIREISQFGRDDTEFNKALKHAAYGQLDDLEKMLDINPALVLLAGNVTTPGGLQVKNYTLLEYALLSGDPEMAKMILPFFDKLKNKDGLKQTGAEVEKQRQLSRCKTAIDELPNQKPDDLTRLIDIIKKSPLKDVQAELATGDQYDKSYQSKLRDALNTFRNEKLDPKVRVITKPQMLCNYQNLIHAYSMLDTEWDNLKEGNSYDKHRLVSRQITGLIHLTELLAFERCIFANDQVEHATKGNKIERSFKYKNDSGAFPDYDKSLFFSHSGVGFGSFVSMWGRRAYEGGAVSVSIYKTYVDQKLQTCRTYAATATTTCVLGVK
jgi:hypothetical protein